MFAKCLERKCQERVESKLEDTQCGFRPDCNTMDQIFSLKQIFEKFWEYAKDVLACFVDLEKAYDQVLGGKLWRVLQEYGIDMHLSMAVKSLYCQPEVCGRVNGKPSKSFHVGVVFGKVFNFVTSPFHNLHELDGQAKPNR